MCPGEPAGGVRRPVYGMDRGYVSVDRLNVPLSPATAPVPDPRARTMTAPEAQLWSAMRSVGDRLSEDDTETEAQKLVKRTRADDPDVVADLERWAETMDRAGFPGQTAILRRTAELARRRRAAYLARHRRLQRQLNPRFIVWTVPRPVSPSRSRETRPRRRGAGSKLASGNDPDEPPDSRPLGRPPAAGRVARAAGVSRRRW
jgi:hypothetical protein